MTRRILVTGATGFIGRAVVAHAAHAGHFVRAVVRSNDVGLGTSGAEIVGVPDIGPDTEWGDHLREVDSVIHLAGRAHVMREESTDPLASFRRTNVGGTLRLARAAAVSRVRRFVFISTIGVNGDRTTTKAFSEDDAPHPRSPYAISKWEAESALRSLAEQTGMEVVIVRPPLVYGPRAPGNLGRLIETIRRGLPLPLGAVSNRRSLVALDNLTNFILTCVERPAAANETFLVSDGHDLSTTELIRGLAAAMGRRIVLLSLPTGLLTVGAAIAGKRSLAQQLLGSLQIDISKARQVLGWTPPVTVDEGLRRAADLDAGRDARAAAQH